MEAICWRILSCAPEPTATMAMTAATPMMMPSIVSAERILLMRSARKAILVLAANFLRFIDVLPRRQIPSLRVLAAVDGVAVFVAVPGCAVPVMTASPSCRSPPVTSR